MISIDEALDEADSPELELVEVDTLKSPPICRIIGEEETKRKGVMEIDIDLDELIEEYPFTIAHSYEAMKDSETPQDKFRRMLLTHIQTVRYLGLLSLSNYLNKDEFKDEEINRKIEKWFHTYEQHRYRYNTLEEFFEWYNTVKPPTSLD